MTYIVKENVEHDINKLFETLDTESVSSQYTMGYITAVSNVLGIINRTQKYTQQERTRQWSIKII